MTPACMTPNELEGWQAMNRHVKVVVKTPCVDCTDEFATAMRAIGSCNGQPWTSGRPLTIGDSPPRKTLLTRLRGRRYRARLAAG